MTAPLQQEYAELSVDGPGPEISAPNSDLRHWCPYNHLSIRSLFRRAYEAKCTDSGDFQHLGVAAPVDKTVDPDFRSFAEGQFCFIEERDLEPRCRPGRKYFVHEH